ncbi:MAG TPA: hypothetical protein PLS84_10630, partial [Salinivirgaceae bacterium]|nr:hypothetical protein [Salinivirgaceae bacterium]
MRSFKVQSKPKHILDLITYDLTTFFYEDDYEEIYSEEILDSFLIDYRKELPWKEFGIFDTVVFRVFTEKSNLTGTNHINVTLHSEEKEISTDKTKLLLQKLEELYGPDDNCRSLKSADEVQALNDGNVVRMWTLDAEHNVYS